MARGGKRPGAGRRKGSKASHTLSAEKAREYLISEVIKDLEPIVTAQKEAARGMWVEETDIHGNRIRVYKLKPDLKTGEYLLNQTVGKPKETMAVTEDVVIKIDV